MYAYVCVCVVWCVTATVRHIRPEPGPSEQSKEIKDKQTNRLLAQTSGKIGKGSLRGTIKEEQEMKRKAMLEEKRNTEKKVESIVAASGYVSFRFVSFVSSLLPLEGAAAWKSVFCFPFDKFTHDLWPR